MAVMDLFRLDEKIAVVTGGYRGLGLMMAEGLAEAGAHVVLCARNLDACERAALAIAETGVQALAVRCDVSSPNDVRVLVERTLSRFGRLDILVNSAGYIWEEPFEKVSLEKWNRTFSANATGVFLCCQAAGRQMILQGAGRIINIASAAGLASVDPELSDSVPHSASKGAVIALTRDLARKWSRHGIQVNAIAPGWFGPRTSADPTERRSQRTIDAIPMKRLGEKDDIKGVAVFLASPASRYVSGQVLAVDGGILA
ncbi:MAG: glucose 1-dehydrogenase [bacterium]